MRAASPKHVSLGTEEFYIAVLDIVQSHMHLYLYRINSGQDGGFAMMDASAESEMKGENWGSNSSK